MPATVACTPRTILGTLAAVPRIFAKSAVTGSVCAVIDTVAANGYPLDRKANADGQRLPFEPDSAGVPAEEGSPDQQLPPLLKQLLAQYAATGLPPAYLPKTLSSQPGETP